MTGLADIVVATIPVEKKLTLIGTGNTIKEDVESFNPAGTLEVAANAELTLNAGTAVAAGKIINNGTVLSDATVAATQKSLVTLPGSGKVTLSGEGAGPIDTATLALTQNVVIASSGKVVAPDVVTPFAGGKTITVTGTGVLDFGATAVTSIGATVVNNGTAADAVTTATTSDAALAVIMGAGGKITASALATLTAAFAVPNYVSLTMSNATFADAGENITVNQYGSLAVSGTATITGAATVSGTATFSGVATVGGSGSVTAGNSTNYVKFTKAKITKGDSSSGVVLAGATATFAATDVLLLLTSGTLETKGSGTAVFGATTFGDTGVWTASATGGTEDTDFGVSITSTADETPGATIVLVEGTGSPDAGALTASGTNPAITQAAGTDGNALTVSAKTAIVLGATGNTAPLGVIRLEKGESPGKLALAVATSIVYTFAEKTAGDAYTNELTSVDADVVIFGITKTEVFQAAGKLTKLIGKEGGASITGTSGSGFNSISSTTVIVGNNG